jgi:hypothetical protein
MKFLLNPEFPYLDILSHDLLNQHTVNNLLHSTHCKLLFWRRHLTPYCRDFIFVIVLHKKKKGRLKHCGLNQTRSAALNCKDYSCSYL